jgi:hypothetical protein
MLSVTKALSEKKSTKVIPVGKADDLTPEEKRECVLRSPRFGMFGLMVHLLEHESGRECSHVFGKQFLLPVFIFVAQWLMLAAIVIHNLKSPFTCQSSAVEHKLLMTAIGMVYFVHSFFVYDQIRDRTKHTKRPCGSSVVTILDTFQEHVFTLFVYIANLYIVFVSENLLDALFNSLALDFLMNLDNQYEELFFRYSLEEAVVLYDTVFVTRDESKRNIAEREAQDCLFKTFRLFTFLPYKILSCGFILLPIYSAMMIVIGILCK